MLILFKNFHFYEIIHLFKKKNKNITLHYVKHHITHIKKNLTLSTFFH